jgi:hypothetical protein
MSHEGSPVATRASSYQWACKYESFACKLTNAFAPARDMGENILLRSCLLKRPPS